MIGAAKDDDGARRFCMGDDVTRPSAEAAIRGALVAQRDRLAKVRIDILSDRAWPADVRGTVQRAERRLAANRRGNTSLTLDPRIDEDFDIALVLAPFSSAVTDSVATARSSGMLTTLARARPSHSLLPRNSP